MRQDDLRLNTSMRYLGDSKKRRKKTFPGLANARAKRWKESSSSGSGDIGDVSGAANDDKENHPMDMDEYDPLLAKERARGDHFRKEKNKAVKKANYWEDQAGKRSADVEELRSSLGMKEKELRGGNKTIRRQNEVIERQEEIISGLQLFAEHKARAKFFPFWTLLHNRIRLAHISLNSRPNHLKHSAFRPLPHLIWTRIEVVLKDNGFSADFGLKFTSGIQNCFDHSRAETPYSLRIPTPFENCAGNWATLSVNATNKRHQVEIHALKEKVRRIPARLQAVMKRAAKLFGKQKDDAQTYHLKQAGAIPDKARDIFAEMVALDNVPANKVVRVFKRIGEVFGVNVKGDVSRRSIGRITKEGGVAAKLQFAEEAQKAKGITLSGDGTSHKNETYETKWSTVITEANEKLQFFLGIKTAVNHTSETQRDGWIELVEEIFALLFESGMCSEDEAREFWNLVTGMNSDHAADQKKLFELLKEWKKKLEREMRGEKVVKGMDQLRLVGFVFKCTQDVPYMREIRGANASEDNVLRLGPLHDRLIAHLDKLIANPELLIGPSVSHETASLDGQPWDHPKAVLAVQKYTPDLPHLENLTVTMLMGARVAWKRFSGEYTEDGAIAQATDEQMERAQMEKTNDRCESSFGVFRQEAKANPNMSLEVHNARQMFKFNKTSEYLRKLSPALRKFLRRVVRKQDGSGANRESKLLLARYKKEGAEVQMEKTRKRAAKKQAASDAIDRVVAILTVTEVEYLANLPRGAPEVWASAVPNKSARGNRDNKVKLWVEAVQRYLAADLPRELRISPRTDPETPDEDEDPAEAVTVEDLGDTDSEKSGYDSEEDYYE
ncbi:hypothetical protein R3P38DRAFT_3351366 [Favolaschia claudopus]|uniref:Uncharacterized protein n=1 Tax=Favolaschia claudopus TaxID=2862362 RepID=A0AAW0C476_9AGAR